MCEALTTAWWDWQRGLCLFWGDMLDLQRTFYSLTRYQRSRPYPAILPEKSPVRAEVRITQHGVD